VISVHQSVLKVKVIVMHGKNMFLGIFLFTRSVTEFQRPVHLRRQFICKQGLEGILHFVVQVFRMLF
jgi:hypothetical protein